MKIKNEIILLSLHFLSWHDNFPTKMGLIEQNQNLNTDI